MWMLYHFLYLSYLVPNEMQNKNTKDNVPATKVGIKLLVFVNV